MKASITEAPAASGTGPRRFRTRTAAGGLLRRAHDRMFRKIHGGNLIYNTCWEDPRLDRAVLELDSASRVVMITSAGCNAFDYLLDGPRELHCIDVNPRQNALLELKLALFRRADFDTLWECFGAGRHDRFAAVYAALRDDLGASAQAFWDRKGYYFGAPRLRHSFYYHGAAGKVAWMVRQMLKARPALRQEVAALLTAPDLTRQHEIFARIEPELWNTALRKMMGNPLALAMLGVPRAQAELIRADHADGVAGYVMARLRYVCTEVPMADNYFWRVYVDGAYGRDCCPNYLRAKHFAALRERADRIRPWTGTLSEFLRRHPGRYTHFVLLDHQDWLAEHDPAGLAEEWELILANAAYNARVVLRSAQSRVDFIPAAASSRLTFHPEFTEPLHRQDRVGTYASFHCATVNT